MNSLSRIIDSFTRPGSLLSLDGFAVVLVGYLLLSWLICIAAAFLKVREVRYYVGMMAMGITLLVALLLGGLCNNYFPDLAASFTPAGLFLFSALAGILVCSVPTIQYFWSVSYWRGLACIVGAVLFLGGGFVAFHFLAHPDEPLPARLSVPLFQTGIPGQGR